MNFQTKKGFSYLEILLISVILVTLTCLLIGNFYDSSDDAIINLLIQGKVGKAHEFPRFYIGVSSLLRFLYVDVASGFPWQAIVFYGLLSFGFAELAFIIQKRFEVAKPKLLLGMFVVFFFLAIEHVMYFNMNRFAILLSGIGLLSIFLTMKSRFGLGLIRGFMLLIIGMAIRPNGGLMAVIILIPAFVIYGVLLKYSWKKNLKFISIIFSSFLILYALFNYSSDKDSIDYKYRNYLKSNIVDFGIVKESGLTNLDKLKIEAIHSGYIADKKITNDFLESVTSNKRLNFTGFQEDKLWRSISTVFTKLFWDYSAYSLFVILLILFSWKGLRKYKVQIVLYNLYLIILPVLIGYFLKIPDKIMGPILFLGFAANLILLVGYCSLARFRFLRLIKLGVAGFFVLYSIKFGHRVYASNLIQNRKAKSLEFVENNFPDKSIITGKYNNQLLYSNPFWEFKNEQCASLNITGWITILPEYRQILESFGKIEDWANVFSCSANEESIIFMFFEKETASFLERYLKQVHNKDYEFVHIDMTNPDMPNQLFYSLRLAK